MSICTQDSPISTLKKVRPRAKLKKKNLSMSPKKWDTLGGYLSRLSDRHKKKSVPPKTLLMWSNDAIRVSKINKKTTWSHFYFA